MNTPRSITRRPGFSLVEIMTVVSIIVLLLALVAPVLKGARKAGRSTICLSNMHQLHIGIAQMAMDYKTGSGEAFSPANWAVNVVPYVSTGPEVLVCPEDETNGESDNGDYSISVWGWPKSWWKGAPVQGWDGKFPFADGPRSKIHQPGEVIPRTNGYTVPNLPNGYVIQFEDWDASGKTGLTGSGTPDLILEVVASGGETTITPVFSSTAGNFALLDPDDNAIWTHLKNKIGQSFTFVGGGASSYGVNSMIEQRHMNSGRLLMMDYTKTIVRAAGATANDDWEDFINSETGYHTFARHGRGRLNAMYTDGGIKMLTVDDIDPDIAENIERHWAPPGEF